MNIEYLNLINEYPILQGSGNVGVGMDIIEKYENENGIVFPKVYKEFLFLAGKQSNILITQNHSFLSTKERQDYTKETLKDYGVSIGENFWVIADLDGGGQFDFFYFNDPDAEDPENPPVYASYPDYIEDNIDYLPLKKKLADTFQEYIEEKIKGYANLK